MSENAYWLSNIVERYKYSGISERKQDDKVNPGYQKYSEDTIKLIAQTIKDCNAETKQKYKQTCKLLNFSHI